MFVLYILVGQQFRPWTVCPMALKQRFEMRNPRKFLSHFKSRHPGFGCFGGEKIKGKIWKIVLLVVWLLQAVDNYLIIQGLSIAMNFSGFRWPTRMLECQPGMLTPLHTTWIHMKNVSGFRIHSILWADSSYFVKVRDSPCSPPRTNFKDNLHQKSLWTQGFKTADSGDFCWDVSSFTS